MVEVRAKGQDTRLQAIVEERLDKIVSDYSFVERGKTIYKVILQFMVILRLRLSNLFRRPAGQVEDFFLKENLIGTRISE